MFSGERLYLLLAVIALITFVAPLYASEPVTLTASDGVKIYGDFYPAASKSAPYILLFHQAGSNRAEYAPIAPRLVKLGFNCLAIDQRSGGNMWGQKNETVEHLGHNGEYLDALKDSEAALAWGKISRRQSENSGLGQQLFGLAGILVGSEASRGNCGNSLVLSRRVFRGQKLRARRSLARLGSNFRDLSERYGRN
jgi:predicted alpha/beta hydrolase